MAPTATYPEKPRAPAGFLITRIGTAISAFGT
jgi:hypothetical protein